MTLPSHDVTFGEAVCLSDSAYTALAVNLDIRSTPLITSEDGCDPLFFLYGISLPKESSKPLSAIATNAAAIVSFHSDVNLE